MDDSEKRSNAERLEALEKENEELRKQLSQIGGKEEDMYSYRIFVEARKKFLTWIGVVIFIITAFGVVSVTNIIQTIKDKIEERGVENIVEQITQDFEEKHQPDIVNETIARLMPTIEARVDEAVREDLLAGIEKVQSEPSGSQEVAFIQALEKSYDEERYFVIAGSSPRPKDLEEELSRVKNEVGDRFDVLFPNVNIYPPFKGNRNYALVIGADLPFSKAKEVQHRAIEMGFREDTFLWRSSRAYFEYK